MSIYINNFFYYSFISLPSHIFLSTSRSSHFNVISIISKRSQRRTLTMLILKKYSLPFQFCEKEVCKKKVQANNRPCPILFRDMKLPAWRKSMLFFLEAFFLKVRCHQFSSFYLKKAVISLNNMFATSSFSFHTATPLSCFVFNYMQLLSLGSFQFISVNQKRKILICSLL